MPRLTVDIANLQRQFAGPEILVLHFQALQGVIQLGIDALTVFRHVGFAVHLHAFQHGHLFPFNRDSNLVEREFLITDTLFKIGHLAVAVGFQVIERQLNLLTVFIDGIDQAALCFTGQGEDISIAVSINLEIPPAKGHFLVIFLVVQCFQIDTGTCVTGVADAGVNLER